jgi:hypothetical protein
VEGGLMRPETMHRILRVEFCALVLAGVRLAAAGPWVETARLVHTGGSANDGLGVSVAVDGDVAVVGQPINFTSAVAGIARVFVRTAGVWNETASLIPSDSAIGDVFGWRVAISGDTIVVGAYLATAGDLAGEGKAYVFVRPAGGWSGVLHENAQLGNFNGAAQTGPDTLGISVAISGSTVVAGAVGSLGGTGLAFVFTEPRTGWSGAINPSATLSAPSGFGTGFSAAISGDVVVVGAPGTNDRDGEAFVWEKPAAGWAGVITESADLLPATPLSHGNQFGDSVAIDADTVVVGAPLALYVNSDNEGTRVAYVFARPSSGWGGTLNETARLVPSAEKLNEDDPAFGSSASVSGDTVVIGTPGLRVFAFVGQDDGGAFIFQKPLAGWSGDVGERAKILRVDSDALHSGLGGSVSISGNTILLGAPFESVNGDASRGAAHVFEPGLNPTVTAAFSPGSVLTYQPSTLSLTVTNPNTTGFIWNLTIGTPLFPGNLFIAGTPNASTTCGGFFDFGSTAGDDQLLLEGGGVPFPAGGTCTVSADVSSAIPGSYTTAALPVFCDQGCDGAGSAPATLLVRLRQTQTRILVQGPIRVAPGVPVELHFQVVSVPEASIAPTGEVVLSDGAGHACRSDLTAGGEGSCALTFGSPGMFQVRATYRGDLSFGGSTSPPAKVFVR